MNDEAEAIARLKLGDIGGLETLVGSYYLPATRAAYLVTRDRAAAEDVVQTAFIRCYEKIYQFDPRREFGPWFLRIVVNDATKLAMRQSRNISLDDLGEPVTSEAEHPILADWLADREADPAELLEQAETRAALWQTLEKLSPGQRAVIVLRYYLELSEAETAAELDCPPGTVKRRLHDARQKLRGLLSGFRVGRPAPKRPSEAEPGTSEVIPTPPRPNLNSEGGKQ